MANISVCMAYYNRREQLENSIRAYEITYDDLELSVVDDRSRPSLVFPATRFDVKFSAIDSDIHTPLNPCVPLNKAVNQSSHDVVVITNPEVMHPYPTLYAMLDVLDDNSYVTARCIDSRGVIAGAEVDYNTAGRLPVPDGAHFHFCAMLTRSLWEKSGGFDEDYRHGQACEDNDFLWRLERIGADFKHVEVPVYHIKSDVKWNLPHNKELFFSKWPHLRP